jgi:hypothetical protein
MAKMFRKQYYSITETEKLLTDNMAYPYMTVLAIKLSEEAFDKVG